MYIGETVLGSFTKTVLFPLLKSPCQSFMRVFFKLHLKLCFTSPEGIKM